MPDMLNHLTALHQVIIDTMFELLESKYPYASTPSIHSVTTILVLLYGLFLKANSMGPTGLRVQRLLDAYHCLLRAYCTKKLTLYLLEMPLPPFLVGRNLNLY